MGASQSTAFRTGAIFTASFLLYALLPSRNGNYADDSMMWAYMISRPAGLINVHHLFFNALRLVYLALTHTPHLHVEPARLLALYAALFGAMGLAYVDALLRLAGLGRVALLGTLVCAFTCGWWTYSIVGDVYVPATACLVAGTYWFFRGTRPGESAVRCGSFAVLALILMMLHHQAYFVFAGALLPGMLVMRGVSRSTLAYGVVVVLSSAAVVFAIYVAVYLDTGVHQPLRVFLAGYVTHTDWLPDQMRVSPGTLVRATAGECRALLSTNVLFRSAALAHAIQARFPYRNVYPHPYLVRGMSAPVVALVGVSSLLALLVGGVLAARGLWRGLRQRDVLAAIFAASLFQAAFFMWWEAVSDEFWIWSTPIVACAVAAGAAGFGRRDRALAGLVAGALGVSTGLGSVAPFADARNDIDAVNVAFLSRVRARDMVVCLDEIQNTGRELLARDRQGFAYHNILIHAVHRSDADDRELEGEIAATLAHGGRVFVNPYVLQPPTSNLVLLRRRNPRFDRQLQAVVTRLAALPHASVVWIAPAATVPGYFERPSASRP